MSENPAARAVHSTWRWWLAAWLPIWRQRRRATIATAVVVFDVAVVVALHHAVTVIWR